MISRTVIRGLIDAIGSWKIICILVMILSLAATFISISYRAFRAAAASPDRFFMSSLYWAVSSALRFSLYFSTHLLFSTEDSSALVFASRIF